MSILYKYIIDSYYVEQLKRAITGVLLVYNADFMFEEDKNEVKIFAKRRVLDEKHYTLIDSFKKAEAFLLMCQLREYER